MGFTFYWRPATMTEEDLDVLEARLRGYIDPSRTRITRKWNTLHMEDREDECETFSVSLTDNEFMFCKTSRTPFSNDVAYALAFMYMDGMIVEGHSDDGSDCEFLKEAVRALRSQESDPSHHERLAEFVRSWEDA